jgi:hypothetical protein
VRETTAEAEQTWRRGYELPEVRRAQEVDVEVDRLKAGRWIGAERGGVTEGEVGERGEHSAVRGSPGVGMALVNGHGEGEAGLGAAE